MSKEEDIEELKKKSPEAVTMTYTGLSLLFESTLRNLRDETLRHRQNTRCEGAKLRPWKECLFQNRRNLITPKVLI